MLSDMGKLTTYININLGFGSRPMAPGLLFLMFLLILFMTGLTAETGNEYCWGQFNATCGSEEVILMKYANFGRMRLGDCISRDYYIGCQADVLQYLDKKCSGRRHCELPVPNSELHSMQPCPKDLLTYLEAEYKCVKVATGRDKYCLQGETIELEDASVGYLASLTTQEYGVGSANCPWEIRAKPGQRINVTLHDFNLSPTRTGDVCQVYALIHEETKTPSSATFVRGNVDTSTTADITVCGGGVRTKNIYISETNVVQITISTLLSDPAYFFVKYEAIGCPDLPKQHGRHVKRQGNKVSVACNNTGEIRHLVCNGTSWVGDVSDCMGTDHSSNTAGLNKDDQRFPLGLLIAIIIGVLLGVILGVIMLIFVMQVWRRKHRNDSCENKIFLTSTSSQGNRQQPDVAPHSIVRTSDYGYAHVWELQQLKSTNPDLTIDKTCGVTHVPSGDCSTYGHSTIPIIKCQRGPIYDVTIPSYSESDVASAQPPMEPYCYNYNSHEDGVLDSHTVRN